MISPKDAESGNMIFLDMSQLLAKNPPLELQRKLYLKTWFWLERLCLRPIDRDVWKLVIAMINVSVVLTMVKLATILMSVSWIMDQLKGNCLWVQILAFLLHQRIVKKEWKNQLKIWNTLFEGLQCNFCRFLLLHSFYSNSKKDFMFLELEQVFFSWINS